MFNQMFQRGIFPVTEGQPRTQKIRLPFSLELQNKAEFPEVQAEVSVSAVCVWGQIRVHVTAPAASSVWAHLRMLH